VGVEVRVEYDVPLGWPGVVLVQYPTVWWVMVDPATEPDAAAMAISHFRTLAALAEVPQEEVGDTDEALLSTRRGGWTWTTAITMAGVAAAVVGLFFLPSLHSSGDAAPEPPRPAPVHPSTTAPGPSVSPVTAVTLPGRTQLSGEVLLASPPLPPSVSTTKVITTVQAAPTVVSTLVQEPPCLLCRVVIKLG